VTQNRACNANQKAKKEKFESQETIGSRKREHCERGRIKGLGQAAELRARSRAASISRPPING
jgi:hypothetical protein